MADDAFTVVDSSGTVRPVDGFTMPNNDFRQAMVIGDPETAADVAQVVSGALQVSQIAPGQAARGDLTATRSSVVPSTSAQTVLAANTNRRGGLIYNNSSGDVYLAFAAGVTTTDFDLILASGQGYELPGDTNMRVTQQITAIWTTSATGTLRVVDWTGA